MKYLILTVATIAFYNVSLFGQFQQQHSSTSTNSDKAISSDQDTEIIIPDEPPFDENAVHVSVEKMPEFIGGSAELYKFIDANLNKVEDIKGRVFVSCIIKRWFCK